MFEIKMNEGIFSVVCKDHGDILMKSEVILTNAKVKEAREKKRPIVRRVSMIMFRCPVCKKYEEYVLEGLMNRE